MTQVLQTSQQQNPLTKLCSAIGSFASELRNEFLPWPRLSLSAARSLETFLATDAIKDVPSQRFNIEACRSINAVTTYATSLDNLEGKRVILRRLNFDFPRGQEFFQFVLPESTPRISWTIHRRGSDLVIDPAAGKSGPAFTEKLIDIFLLAAFRSKVEINLSIDLPAAFQSKITEPRKTKQ